MMYAGTISGLLLATGLRMIAMKYNWNLPKVKVVNYAGSFALEPLLVCAFCKICSLVSSVIYPASVETERADCAAFAKICSMLSAVMYAASIESETACWWACAKSFLISQHR